jgi:hypothetical protein
MARTNQAEARERARAARRRLDEQRQARDKKIDDATLEFYAGQALVEEGTAQRDAALVQLLDDLAEPVETVALLLDLDAKEITRLRRQAKSSSAGAEPTGSGSDAGGSGQADGAADGDGHAA